MVEVLWQDNHLLILNKPAGLLTQPSGTDRPSLEAEAKQWLGRPYLEAVHRLDRPASGIVIFARTSKALRRMMALIREGEIKKIYHARVEGTPPDSGVLDHFLLREEHRTRVVPEGTPGAKRALLRFRHLGQNLLEVELITGRTHQIRVQLAEIGCPIVGDGKYGASPAKTIALHHAQCRFIHPVTGEELAIKASSDL